MMLALLLCVVGGLVMAPLLGLMSTGLITGQIYEDKTLQLYAADAGVEDAVWKIQEGVEELPGPACGGQPPNYWSYNVTDDTNTINGKDVEVTITYVDSLSYQVVSTAADGRSATQIEAYVVGETVSANYSGMTDHIITSQGEYDVKDKVVLVYAEGHEPVEYYDGDWPDEPDELEMFALFYWLDVEDEMHYYGDTTIDLEGQNLNLGPFYVEGQLEIVNSIATNPTVTLNGTIYVTGDTLIGQTNQDFTLDLNGQAIFVESDSADALIVGGKCTVGGPGCIIAIGDVYFAPKGDVGNNGEPVFVLSAQGTTRLQPSGDYYGAIAGSVEVETHQGTTPTIYYPELGFGGQGDLNFPGFVAGKLIYHIATWEINP